MRRRKAFCDIISHGGKVRVCALLREYEDRCVKQVLVVETAGKINLTIDVLGRRPDGYHEVAMVMQSVGIYDRISLELIDEPQILLDAEVQGVTRPQDNLVYKVAALYLHQTGKKKGVQIRLEKNIPIAAGLAGGSSDAAAVLKGLNILHGEALTEKDLMRLAAQIGSDIPFCLKGGTAFASGRGEVIKPLTPLADCAFVLLKPPFCISTAQVYKVCDERPIIHPDNVLMQKAVKEGNIEAIGTNLSNALEAAAFSIYPQLAEYKKRIISCGAMNALMSGSGTTLFGLCRDLERAELVKERLVKHCPEAQIFSVRPVAGQRIREA